MSDKPIQLILLSDCKSHTAVTEPTPFHKVYKGRMYGTARNAINICKLYSKVDIQFVTVSAVYGLLWGDMEIENYRQRISVAMADKLRPKVCQNFVKMWDEFRAGGQKVDKIFSSLSTQHHLALPLRWIASVVGEDAEIVVAHGGIGTRQGQLKTFLCGREYATEIPGSKEISPGGGVPFIFKGTTYTVTTEKAEQIILEELEKNPYNSMPTTWYCEIQGKQLSCKFAMSCLIGREYSLSHFTTQRAVQVLRKVGIECKRLDI